VQQGADCVFYSLPVRLTVV